MDRRKFLARSVLGGAALSAIGPRGHKPLLAGEKRPAGPRGADNPAGSAVTAGDVHDYLRSLGDQWVDAQRTVDTFKAGDPKLAVEGIAVAWMSYFDALRKARELGCNLFITHEPTYYNHLDRDESVFAFEVARKKREFVRQKGWFRVDLRSSWVTPAEMMFIKPKQAPGGSRR